LFGAAIKLFKFFFKLAKGFERMLSRFAIFPKIRLARPIF
jgi:hypothetical protein